MGSGHNDSVSRPWWVDAPIRTADADDLERPAFVARVRTLLDAVQWSGVLGTADGRGRGGQTY